MGNFCSEMFYPLPVESRNLKTSRKRNELFVIPELSPKMEFTLPDETPSEISDMEEFELI
jgi:hypothetical protein